MPDQHLTRRTRSASIPIDAATTVTFVAWRDHVVEAHPESHRTAANDTLVWWTPILGPTPTLLAHRVAGYLDRTGECRFTVGELAATFGLGQSTGRVDAALRRLERFEVVSVIGDTVAVRIALPPLTARRVAMLPSYLADLHQQRRHTIRTTTDTATELQS